MARLLSIVLLPSNVHYASRRNLAYELDEFRLHGLSIDCVFINNPRKTGDQTTRGGYER